MRSAGSPPSQTSPAVLMSVLFVTLSAVLLAGCGSTPPVTSSTQSPSPESTVPVTDRTRLAAAAAAASDLRMTAFYRLTTAGRPDRTVAVTIATDGSWRVDVPGGALGGAVDVAMVRDAGGLFQCVLPSAGQTGQTEPTEQTEQTEQTGQTGQPGQAGSCVRLGEADAEIDPAVDPRVQHLFTDWPAVLADRRAPLAVSEAEPLSGVDGTCFSVESTTASLSPPLDVGIYCYRADGTLTGARLGLGTLGLAGAPGAAPPSITLPGPVTAGSPVRVESPPASATP
ncbi:hypothetical protein O7632_31195 [Solwaraspora sp. WMMD406]|uniref:hypothetical protein n=1 Tax=Solwaraspora sp. WMMD406 TaxID=3016095 RepID=UPI0024168E5C|nr:hypothetical protein [Solwaraspora sp. WMMD406]MDG4768527.1 hypothetical protein [Solwaraspora sp. WMMD406]